MARPTSRKKTGTSKAVNQLRAKLGDSQQAFANRLGIALQTVARWETQGTISGDALLRLAELSSEVGAEDLYVDFIERWFIDASPNSLSSKLQLHSSLREYFGTVLRGLSTVLQTEVQSPEIAERILVAICGALPAQQIRMTQQLMDQLRQAGKLSDLVANPTNKPIERLQAVSSVLRNAWIMLNAMGGSTIEKVQL